MAKVKVKLNVIFLGGGWGHNSTSVFTARDMTTVTVPSKTVLAFLIIILVFRYQCIYVYAAFQFCSLLSWSSF